MCVRVRATVYTYMCACPCVFHNIQFLIVLVADFGNNSIIIVKDIYRCIHII